MCIRDSIKGLYFDTLINLGAERVAVSRKKSTVYVFVQFNEWRMKSLEDVDKTYRSCIIETGEDYQIWITYLQLLDPYVFHNFHLLRPVYLDSPFKSGLCEDFITKRKISSFEAQINYEIAEDCLLYTSPSPRDRTRSRMPSSA